MSSSEQSCKTGHYSVLNDGINSGEVLDAQAERLVVIGGSAGALAALRVFLSALVSDSREAFVVALHGGGAVLASLLQDGCVYLAPPGTHIVVRPDTSLVTPRTARRDAYRPSVDWLFESAAATYGEAATAVVLSGTMSSDGVAGAKAIRRAGGRVFVQHPETAAYPEMPRAVMASGATDVAFPATLAALVSAAGTADQIGATA